MIFLTITATIILIGIYATYKAIKNAPFINEHNSQEHENKN
jgi:hypothetical protein